MKVARLSAYQDLLKLGRERKGAIFLDLGCCCTFSVDLFQCPMSFDRLIYPLSAVGNDVRKVVHDGYPVENAIASDLRRGNQGAYRFEK